MTAGIIAAAVVIFSFNNETAYCRVVVAVSVFLSPAPRFPTVATFCILQTTASSNEFEFNGYSYSCYAVRASVETDRVIFFIIIVVGRRNLREKNFKKIDRYDSNFSRTDQRRLE